MQELTSNFRAGSSNPENTDLIPGPIPEEFQSGHLYLRDQETTAPALHSLALKLREAFASFLNRLTIWVKL